MCNLRLLRVIATRKKCLKIFPVIGPKFCPPPGLAHPYPAVIFLKIESLQPWEAPHGKWSWLVENLLFTDRHMDGCMDTQSDCKFKHDKSQAGFNNNYYSWSPRSACKNWKGPLYAMALVRHPVHRMRCLMGFFFFFSSFFLFCWLPAWTNLGLAVANFHRQLSYLEQDFSMSKHMLRVIFGVERLLEIDLVTTSIRH